MSEKNMECNMEKSFTILKVIYICSYYYVYEQNNNIYHALFKYVTLNGLIYY